VTRQSNEPPSKWRWVSLGDLAPQSDAFVDGPFGSNLKTEHYTASGVRVVRLQNIGRGTFLDNDRAFVSPEHFADLMRHSVLPGDVVVASLGDGARPAGRACLIPADFGQGLVKADCFRLRLPQEIIATTYLVYFMNSPQCLTRVAEIMRGATRPRVTLGMLRTLSLPLPPLSEQMRIASWLDEAHIAVERARAAAEVRYDAALQLRSACVTALFEGRDAMVWPRRKIGAIARVVGGIQKSPGRAPVSFHKPYLTVRNVQRGFLDFSEVERFEATSEEHAKLRLLPGDLLIVEGNGSIDQIGRNALFEDESGEWIHQNHVIRVRTSQEIALPRFLSHYLNSRFGMRQMIEKAQTTSGLYTLSVGKVADLEVPVPSLAAQEQALANLECQLKRVDRTTMAADVELSAVRDLPRTLLRQAFSGEL